jgi:hypothetical protein
MTVRTSAGSTIAISATLPATFDEAGFSAAGVVFKEIGEVTNIGEHGREYSKVTFQPLRTRATQKRKGSYDPGTIALQFGIDGDDEAQGLLKTASKSDNNYAFRLTYQNGDIEYFQAQVMSFKTSVGGVDDITSGTANLEINADDESGEDIVFVPHA